MQDIAVPIHPHVNLAQISHQKHNKVRKSENSLPEGILTHASSAL